MNGLSRHFCGCGARDRRGPSRHALLAPLLAAAAISGCDGGSGGGLQSEPVGRTAPLGGGTVIVTAIDVLRAPLAGANIRLRTYRTETDQDAFADANGRAEFANVPETFSVDVYVPETAGSLELRGWSVLQEKLAAREVRLVEVTASPTDFAAGGIAAASVTAGGISDDGRIMELSLKIIQVRHPSERESLDSGVSLLPCMPGTSTDPLPQRSKCVSGADEFDAPYDRGRILSIKMPSVRSELPAPYTAALLLNQSASVIVDDPADARLFAAKYFLTYASTDSPKVLAAFASDAPGTAGFSLLPQQPVSLFPVENPQYTSDGRSYFPTVDALGAMEGGGEPLYAALDGMLDFAAANQTDGGKAIVVISSGRDDTCGSTAECRAIRDAVIRKSQATDVAIVTIGVPTRNGEVDHETLGLLAQSTPRGAAFWAETPEQLAMTVSSAHSYLARQKNLWEVTFQIQSPVAGAFASGRHVLGTVQLEECPWDCYYISIPFVVRLP
jgi:hypothetical protein